MTGANQKKILNALAERAMTHLELMRVTGESGVKPTALIMALAHMAHEAGYEPTAIRAYVDNLRCEFEQTTKLANTLSKENVRLARALAEGSTETTRLTAMILDEICAANTDAALYRALRERASSALAALSGRCGRASSIPSLRSRRALTACGISPSRSAAGTALRAVTGRKTPSPRCCTSTAGRPRIRHGL